jgi:hypothetical protein
MFGNKKVIHTKFSKAVGSIKDTWKGSEYAGKPCREI